MNMEHADEMNIELVYANVANKLDEIPEEAKDFALWYLLKDEVERMEKTEIEEMPAKLLHSIVLRGANDLLANLQYEVF